MPFIDEAGAELDRLPLLYRLGREFQVTEPFRWQDPRDPDRILEIPAHDTSKPPTNGNGTDFASVPPFLWGLVASYGKQTLPSILHDALAHAALMAPKGRGLELRRTADETFRVALIESGVSRLLARAMWAAVGIERYARHGGTLGLIFIAQLIAGASAVMASVALGAAVHPLWLTLGVLPALGALAWRRNADLMLATSYLGALYSPLVGAAFLASRLVQLLAFVVWVASGCRGSRPHAVPTLRWPSRAATL